MTDAGDLATSYYRHFQVVRANNQHFLDKVYRLRYQVYCIENSFENSNEHHNGIERDEYDETSDHVLLLHRRSGAAVGTVRLIIPQFGSLRRPLPVWHVLRPAVRQEFERFPFERTAEVSRFAISKEFRRWLREHRYHIGDDSTTAADEQMIMQYVTFGLFLEIVDVAIENGVSYFAAVMRSSLIRLFSRLGLDFEPIGTPIEHHGIRQPCIVSVADLLQRASDCSPLRQFISFRHAVPAG